MEDQYLLKIADYLDGKMSPDEEEGFMKEVGENAVLRELFEQEMVLGAQLQEAPIRKMFPYRWVAAAAILIAAVLYFSRKQPTQTTIAAKPTVVDTIRTDLFSKYYSPYEAKNDPVEVSYYYAQYRAGHYSSVLSARPEDFQVLGTASSRNAQLKRYMQFYKGLCWLGKNQPDEARRYLDSASQEPSLTYAAEWYSLLAALQAGDRTAVRDLAGRLAAKANPYQDKANAILSGH